MRHTPNLPLCGFRRTLPRSSLTMTQPGILSGIGFQVCSQEPPLIAACESTMPRYQQLIFKETES
jgi:hypothetical protein